MPLDLYGPLKTPCTELRQLKYKLILSMMTIGSYGPPYLVWLKFSVLLKRKLNDVHVTKILQLKVEQIHFTLFTGIGHTM